jgi:hypothetical protein
MLQGKVENLELKAEIRSLKLKDNVEEDNESFQHQQTKGRYIWEKSGLIQICGYYTIYVHMISGIPYDVQLTKTDNETLFGFKILTRENHHFISTNLQIN